MFPTDDVRPGTTGKKAVKMESSSVLGVSANGTITTGRMKAGSYTASDPNNCTFMDLSLTDVDGNGQLFANNIAGEPTALHFWYKFKMGARTTGNAANKTASVNSLLTDGTYCQDPADKEYNNIVAVAKDVTSMGDTNGEWKEMTVNFSYKDVDVFPASLLITFSTCAVAGGGSSDNNDPDVLYIDDVELVYAPVPVALYIFICSSKAGSVPGMTRPMVSSTVVPTNSVMEQFIEIFSISCTFIIVKSSSITGYQVTSGIVAFFQKNPISEESNSRRIKCNLRPDR